MDNLDDSENNVKISDSAYSNSCSNSQSRRSHSSKSTHLGSNSSGSSGYCGKPSTSRSSLSLKSTHSESNSSGSSGYCRKPLTSGSSNNVRQPPKKDKESRKKKVQIETPAEVQTEVEYRPRETTTFIAPNEENHDVVQSPPSAPVQTDNGPEDMEASSQGRESTRDEGGFSCVISMHDGVVMYTTSSLTTTLGFPKDMWICRSFIDFVHPRDRNTFASQITSGLAVPKIVNGTQEKGDSNSTIVCRIRRYRGLKTGFGVKDRVVTYMPFLLKFTFKNINDEDGKVIYLVIQSTPFYSAFKIPNEVITKAIPFVLRHDANGNIEYIDAESVPYLGHLPQEMIGKDALQLYHPDDLGYIRQAYETIVKEGSLARSKPFRMITQNGDSIKVETEWSSFINPWSRKLEFVIGKHHIIEGPTNPDVFQIIDPEKAVKLSEEDKAKAQILRESILRIMTEVLTKPAEVAKQNISKRCQDLASFMESLLEEQPKTDDELRLEIQDPCDSYYDRDSVMLGGISPHHGSKSSSETPLSYNQLNYNENLQRFFKSHQPYSYEDYNTVSGENILGLSNTKMVMANCLSPIAQNSGDSCGELTSSCESSGMAVGGGSPPAPLSDYPPLRLTESLLTKHNAEMEKLLMKLHRENRSISKGDREKASNENRIKKKEHLARCNASYQPSTVGVTFTEPQPHGIKRSLKQVDPDVTAHKHHCSTQRQYRRRLSTSATVEPPSSTITTTAGASHWQPNPANNMNTFILGMGIPQQMSIVSPVPAIPGVFPMYYASAPTAASIPTSTVVTNTETPSCTTFQSPTVPCMMYGQSVYGQPFMYSPMTPQVPYPVQQTLMPQTMRYTNPSLHPFGLTSSNYEEQSIEAVADTASLGDGKSKINRLGNSEETVDRTDGESSYSSFYSSFFKTESGSTEDSGDAKKAANKSKVVKSGNTDGVHCKRINGDKVARRKMEPPWMEQVCLTSELVYKYQILNKTMDEVLLADKQKMKNYEQPSLINEQLGQLYLDLQLEGVAARLTLEEGITSSSSSGEETSTASKDNSRKRQYSKLVMIYEADAPLPPSPEEEANADAS